MSAQGVSIINVDDLYGKRLLNLTRSRIITYGLNNKSRISACDIHFDIKGTRFIALTPKWNVAINTKLIGRHNVYNILASVSLAFSENLEPDIIKNAIDKFSFVPGRLQRIDCRKDFSVFVDYAHTDDALKNVLMTLRELSPAKIIVVFGCGGNRDRTKRPKMGQAASELSDFAIITSDNPRDEEPQDIIKDISRGIRKKNYKIISDRETAILDSLKMAKPGDIVLIAGKGHENYQIFKNKRIHFDDREIVKKCLKSLS
jgi:UDP-N-acetylmuramoyl-L-alanyl-D-glutamate--2,6-diaminopimelate ligase